MAYIQFKIRIINHVYKLKLFAPQSHFTSGWKDYMWWVSEPGEMMRRPIRIVLDSKFRATNHETLDIMNSYCLNSHQVISHNLDFKFIHRELQNAACENWTGVLHLVWFPDNFFKSKNPASAALTYLMESIQHMLQRLYTVSPESSRPIYEKHIIYICILQINFIPLKIFPLSSCTLL